MEEACRLPDTEFKSLQNVVILTEPFGVTALTFQPWHKIFCIAESACESPIL